MRRVLIWLIVASLLLGACSTGQSTPPPRPATLAPATSTPVQEPGAANSVSPTPIPPAPVQTQVPPSPTTASSPPTADVAGASVGTGDQTPAERSTPAIVTSAEEGPQLKLTIVYDNTAKDARLRAEWGFAALIEYAGRTLLFDTGADGPTLLDNMEVLGVDPEKIETIVLSHEHGDHTGGLQALLDQGITPMVYVPAAFPTAIKDGIRSRTGLEEVTGPLEILPGIYSTGQMGSEIVEQGLVISTAEGPLVVTGCAHPGIVEMARRSQEIVEGKIALVVGGFHLGNTGRSAIEGIIADFQELGVRQVSPTHCTGTNAIAKFATAYGDDYLEGGAGRVIVVVNPQPSTAALPTFEPADCQFERDASHRVECGYRTAPEKHSRPENGRTVRLHVAIFKSTAASPKPDPVIYLSGAGNQLDGHDRYLYAGGDEIIKHRD